MERVLHILNTSSFSGAENVAITIINNITAEDGFEHIYASLEGTIRDVLKENGIRFYPLEKLNVKNVRKAVKIFKPDIIHAHDFTAGIISSLSCFKIPIINHLHNNSPWLKTFSVKSVAYGLSALRYKKIITVSNSVMEEYIFGRFFKKKSTVVGNPINLNSIIKKAENAEITDSSDVALLGRITPQKNPSMFVDIISELKKKLPNINAAMIGDGELRDEIALKIEKLGLKENIKMYGFVKNPYGLLKNARVLCMPSLWEGFGLAAVEALALGTPVIASPVGGLGGVVNEKCGKLCKEKEEYVNEIFELLQNEKLYAQKKEGAFERAKELDNIKQYKKVLLDVYMSQIKKREID